MNFTELLLILLVALLAFGPSKLPMLAKHLGQLIGKLNDYKQQATSVWQTHLENEQLEENTRKALEADRQYAQKKSKE